MYIQQADRSLVLQICGVVVYSTCPMGPPLTRNSLRIAINKEKTHRKLNAEHFHQIFEIHFFLVTVLLIIHFRFPSMVIGIDCKKNEPIIVIG